MIFLNYPFFSLVNRIQKLRLKAHSKKVILLHLTEKNDLRGPSRAYHPKVKKNHNLTSYGPNLFILIF